MEMILLFTDFGYEGPYVGQMHVVLARDAPDARVIDLMHDAPAHDPRAAAYMLAALVPDMPERAVCVAVVDPGVGTDRPPVVLEADGRWFVGPGNGLFELVQRRATAARQWRIDWEPARLSASFHGRDLFAPVAAMLARGDKPPGVPFPDGWQDAADRPGTDWPGDLAEIIYCDRFGNAMTGLRAASCAPDTIFSLSGRLIRHARVFGEAAAGAVFWYENSIGLVEIALRDGSAAGTLGIGPGDTIVSA
jgi:S-adenosylmethionine hydrolase